MTADERTADLRSNDVRTVADHSALFSALATASGQAGKSRWHQWWTGGVAVKSAKSRDAAAATPPLALLEQGLDPQLRSRAAHDAQMCTFEVF